MIWPLTSATITFLVDMCRESVAELDIIPVLLQSFELCFASPKFKVQCLITLAACIEECGKTSFDFCLIEYGYSISIVKREIPYHS